MKKCSSSFNASLSADECADGKNNGPYILSHMTQTEIASDYLTIIFFVDRVLLVGIRPWSTTGCLPANGGRLGVVGRRSWSSRRTERRWRGGSSYFLPRLGVIYTLRVRHRRR